MTDPTLCIHHSPCADGFAAAWAVWTCYGDRVRYHPGVYGAAPPSVAGEHVLLVDFSYKAPVLRQLASEAASITILDHHVTAEADLAPLLAEGVVRGQFDMTRSGTVITWQYLYPDTPVPTLLQHVQDRDLWRFALPGTREIQACVFSHPYDFDTWSWLVERCDSPAGRAGMLAEGAAIERKHQKDIAELVAATRRTMVIGGVTVPVANLPYTMASDAAGQMAEGQPFAACYFDRPDARVFSLRSRGTDGMDVAAIAQSYGGGGHKQASGFQAPPGWEGDAPR